MTLKGSSFHPGIFRKSQLAYSLAACFAGLLFVAPMLAQETHEKMTWITSHATISCACRKVTTSSNTILS